jgi:hypothetical protein
MYTHPLLLMYAVGVNEMSMTPTQKAIARELRSVARALRRRARKSVYCFTGLYVAANYCTRRAAKLTAKGKRKP